MIALFATVVASLVIPHGFYEAKRLEPAASWVAQKPVQVWCAKTRADFMAAAAENTDNPDASGFAVVGSTAEFLPPNLCGALLAWMNHRGADDYMVAMGLLGLAHEAEHLRGISDEGATDCAALAKLPAIIRRFFPTKGHDVGASMLMLYARDAHTREGAAYAGGC